MNKKNILSRIKKIIEENNLSNSEFAEKIGIPKSSVTHLLSERNNPSLDIIIKISSLTSLFLGKFLFLHSISLHSARYFNMFKTSLLGFFILIFCQTSFGFIS